MIKRTFRKILPFTLLFVIGFLIGVSGTYWSLMTLMKARATIAWTQGIEYIKNKEYEQAIAVLNQAIAQYPKDYMFYSTLAVAYEAKKEYNLALYEYECALILCTKELKNSVICKDIERRLNKVKKQIELEKGYKKGQND